MNSAQALADRINRKVDVTGQTHCIVETKAGYRVVKQARFKKSTVMLVVMPGQTLQFTTLYHSRKP